MPSSSSGPGSAPSRRALLRGGLAGLAWLWAGRPGARADGRGVLGFASLPPTNADRITLPPGYEHRVVFAWGDPVVAGAPAFDPGARQDGAAQALQAGMHHDGMELFRLEGAAGAAPRWLLAVNHEFTDEGLLHPGWAPPDAARVARSQAAVGVSVIEVRPRAGGGFEQVVGSPFGRRITARTPIVLAGPAAGHALLQTAADPTGRRVLGTLANCAAGRTPWGTYLTCEENIQYFFVRSSGTTTGSEDAYAITDLGLGYGWHAADPRFDTAHEPHEVHRFGWVVEVDPRDPVRAPVKRTALGRFAHENAHVWSVAGRPLAVYMGDDAAFQFLYKYVSREDYRPPTCASAPGGLDGSPLDDGTLYVARLHDDGRGEWIPLVHGRPGLTRVDGFPDQAHVVCFARLAGRSVGATPLDRPEWVAQHPGTRRLIVSLTNNVRRGARGAPGVDGANPAAPNVFGHLLELEEHGADPAATAFRWSLFARGGPRPWVRDAAGSLAQPAFGSPDGLLCDARGVLWIQTDVGAVLQSSPEHAGFPNNQVLAVDPVTHEVRRFLVGPVGCELTGLIVSDDLRTLLVNVQHPGEPGLAGRDHSDPTQPWRSSWPAQDGASRPRSATIAVWRTDGRPVGA